MLRCDVRHSGRGVIVVEVVAALGLLAALVALTGAAVVQYQRTREYTLWSQAAAWAAEAQLQRYRAGAAIDSPPPPDMLAEAISLRTQTEPGQGSWAGFRRVTVSATVERPGRKPIRRSVTGYLLAEGAP